MHDVSGVHAVGEANRIERNRADIARLPEFEACTVEWRAAFRLTRASKTFQQEDMPSGKKRFFSGRLEFGRSLHTAILRQPLVGF